MKADTKNGTPRASPTPSPLGVVDKSKPLYPLAYPPDTSHLPHLNGKPVTGAEIMEVVHRMVADGVLELRHVDSPLNYDVTCMDVLLEADYVSIQLTLILKWLDSMKQLHKFAQDSVGKLDDINSDLIHEMELTEPTPERLLEIATSQRHNRIDRRQAKHTAWSLEPLVEALEKDEVKKGLAKIQEALGQVRKNESRQENQVYTPKQKDVIAPDALDKNGTIPTKPIQFGMSNISGYLK